MGERALVNTWGVACPKCGAPVDRPCLDFRTYDRFLFGRRVHPERRAATKKIVGDAQGTGDSPTLTE
jgi:hypothetical protein